MNRIILTAAACAFSAVLFGFATVQADPPPTPSAPAPKKAARKADRRKAAFARVSRPRDYRWSSYCWFPKLRCYGYFSATDRGWYYWYEPMARFLPVRYMRQYPPTAMGVAPVGPVAAPTGALPPGATQVPPTPPASGAPAPVPNPPASADPLPVPM